MDTGALVCEGLTKRYGTTLAVDRLDLVGAGRVAVRPGRAERRGQDDDAVDGHRAAAARRRARGRGRGRRLVRRAAGPPRCSACCPTGWPSSTGSAGRSSSSTPAACTGCRGPRPPPGPPSCSTCSTSATPAARWSSTTPPACARRSAWRARWSTRRGCSSSTSRSRRSTRCPARPSGRCCGGSPPTAARSSCPATSWPWSSSCATTSPSSCAGQVVAAGTVDEVRGGGSLEDRFVELSGGSRGLGGGLTWLASSSG